MKVKKGDTIRIVRMDDMGGTDRGVSRYNGMEGTVTHIDGIGQLHGTWGGLAINPDVDEFIVTKEG